MGVKGQGHQEQKTKKYGMYRESSSGAPSSAALHAGAATPVGKSAHAV